MEGLFEAEKYLKINLGQKAQHRLCSVQHGQMASPCGPLSLVVMVAGYILPAWLDGRYLDYVYNHLLEVSDAPSLGLFGL